MPVVAAAPRAFEEDLLADIVKSEVSQSLGDRWFAIVAPLSGIPELLDGALSLRPSMFVEDSDAQHLTDDGQRFLRIVYGRLVEALSAADVAWADTKPLNQEHRIAFIEEAHGIYRALQGTLLMARGLLCADVPEALSAHDGMELLRERVRTVLSHLDRVEPLTYGETPEERYHELLQGRRAKLRGLAALIESVRRDVEEVTHHV